SVVAPQRCHAQEPTRKYIPPSPWHGSEQRQQENISAYCKEHHGARIGTRCVQVVEDLWTEEHESGGNERRQNSKCAEPKYAEHRKGQEPRQCHIDAQGRQRRGSETRQQAKEHRVANRKETVV